MCSYHRKESGYRNLTITAALVTASVHSYAAAASISHTSAKMSELATAPVRVSKHQNGSTAMWSAGSTDLFSNREIALLIELVQGLPVLYAADKKLFKGIIPREKAWKVISEKLSRTGKTRGLFSFNIDSRNCTPILSLRLRPSHCNATLSVRIVNFYNIIVKLQYHFPITLNFGRFVRILSSS